MAGDEQAELICSPTNICGGCSAWATKAGEIYVKNRYKNLITAPLAGSKGADKPLLVSEAHEDAHKEGDGVDSTP